MRSIWNGTLSFGLVNIPIKIYTAVKENEFRFHLLHEADQGRISNERVCIKCAKNVDYQDLVRGYEYEKGKHVLLTDEDFEKVSVESSKSITILDFVDADEIDPMYFDKPYYLVPAEEGEELYLLLRETLKRTNKVGIARIVFHDREHLAAIKLNGRAIMLDTMHFADEIREDKGLKLPAANAKISDDQIQMAARLVESMSSHFDPERYRDNYREDLLDLIDKKLAGKTIKVTAKPKEATSVVDIISKLKASIEQTEGKTGKRKKGQAA